MASASPRFRLRVLIVEDHPPTWKALRTLLERQGCQVDVAESIAEAFNRLGVPLDFVILDLMLPDGDGLTVLQALRERVQAPRVVVTSGTGDGERLARARALAPDALLRKPVDLSQLYKVLGLPR